MKKVLFLIMVLPLLSCGNKTTVSTEDVDSCDVDTCVVDTCATDTVIDCPC